MNRFLLFTFACLAWAGRLAAQTDTVPPQLVCKDAFLLNLWGCNSQVWPATDFLDSFSDNTTPDTALHFGVRRSCTGDGFPENKPQLTFWWTDLYRPQIVEVWARDQLGNTDSCKVYVFPIDPGENCHFSSSVTIWTPDTIGVAKVSILIRSTHCLLDTLDTEGLTFELFPGFAAWAQAGNAASTGYHTTVTPTKNINPLNGLSTFDLVLIQKHIFGIESFNSPYKIIAADANQDGQLTSFDLVVLKKLLLGITTELPNGRSWRFVPYEYVFPDPTNPFLQPFPEIIQVPNTVEPTPQDFNFIGIKIGDVNYSADPGQ